MRPAPWALAVCWRTFSAERLSSGQLQAVLLDSAVWAGAQHCPATIISEETHHFLCVPPRPCPSFCKESLKLSSNYPVCVWPLSPTGPLTDAGGY